MIARLDTADRTGQPARTVELILHRWADRVVVALEEPDGSVVFIDWSELARAVLWLRSPESPQPQESAQLQLALETGGTA